MDFDEWLKDMERWDGEHYACMDIAQAAWDYQHARINALTAEIEEQARLLGASGSREVELLARIEALENPNKERQVFAAKMLATFTQPDVDCYLLAGIIYTAMQEPKMAAALVREPTND